jgi:hypothetical protein
MSAHTPGPWEYRPHEFDDWGTVKSGRFVICQARDRRCITDEALASHRKAGTDPWESNARLISAAPELLEALEGVVTRCGPRSEDGAKARAAIAKAKGAE